MGNFADHGFQTQAVVRRQRAADLLDQFPRDMRGDDDSVHVDELARLIDLLAQQGSATVHSKAEGIGVIGTPGGDLPERLVRGRVGTWQAFKVQKTNVVGGADAVAQDLVVQDQAGMDPRADVKKNS